MNTEEEDFEGGMTDAQINAKHLRLRGNMAYKYPPLRSSRCRRECGVEDYYYNGDKPPIEHQCFLAPEHQGPCEFSSECAAST